MRVTIRINCDGADLIARSKWLWHANFCQLQHQQQQQHQSNSNSQWQGTVLAAVAVARSEFSSIRLFMAQFASWQKKSAF